MNQVSDLMTKNVISVFPDMPITEAARILYEQRLNGVPVIDKEKKVVGILTEYDLLTKGTSIHLPTLLKLFKEFDLYKKDKSSIKEELASIISTQVKDVMNNNPLVIPPTMSIEDATKTFSEHHRINPIVVVDEAQKLLGVLSRYDLIKLYSGSESFMPNSKKPERKLDDRINNFLDYFEKEYLFVSKFRTHYWLIFSLLFAIIGFIVSMALIIRVNFK